MHYGLRVSSDRESSLEDLTPTLMERGMARGLKAESQYGIQEQIRGGTYPNQTATTPILLNS